jgi:hypothetical protein
LQLLFYVFKHLLIILHFHLRFYPRFNVGHLYTNFVQVLRVRSILILPFQLFFSSQIFSSKDLRYKLASLLFPIFDHLVSKNLSKISQLFHYFCFLIHSNLFQITFLSHLFLSLTLDFNFSNFRCRSSSLTP